MYYPEGEIGDGWYRAEEWAESIGIIRKWFHPNGYDEIIGAIIDGVSYGVTTGVERPGNRSVTRLALWPLPATSTVQLGLIETAGSEVAITITDMRGAEVLRVQSAAPTGRAVTVDVSGIPAGTYIVTATRGPQRLTAPLVVAR